MTHKHTPNQTTKVRRSNDRAKLVTELSALLWDESKSAGEEGVPEHQWEAVLSGPCNGDTQLIAEVCQYERYLRSDSKEPLTLEVSVPAETYLHFLFGFFTLKTWPLHLLWKIEQSEWADEDDWDKLLEVWTEGTARNKEDMKAQARELRNVRETGRYTYTL